MKYHVKIAVTYQMTRAFHAANEAEAARKAIHMATKTWQGVQSVNVLDVREATNA